MTSKRDKLTREQKIMAEGPDPSELQKRAMEAAAERHQQRPVRVAVQLNAAA